MNKLAKRAIVVATAVLTTSGVALATAQADPSVVTTSASQVQLVADARPMSDPPGACEWYEEGEYATGEDGYLYECYYVESEDGYYWLPV
jgi:hypothetical protein